MRKGRSYVNISHNPEFLYLLKKTQIITFSKEELVIIPAVYTANTGELDAQTKSQLQKAHMICGVLSLANFADDKALENFRNVDLEEETDPSWISEVCSERDLAIYVLFAVLSVPGYDRFKDLVSQNNIKQMLKLTPEVRDILNSLLKKEFQQANTRLVSENSLTQRHTLVIQCKNNLSPLSLLMNFL